MLAAAALIARSTTGAWASDSDNPTLKSSGDSD